MGITIGVAALICVMSVFNGFRELTESQIVGFDPHLRIVPNHGAWISGSDEIIAGLKQIDDIVTITELINCRVAAIKSDKVQVFHLKSISEIELKQQNSFRDNILLGSFDYSESGLPKLVLGAYLADRLRILPGDTLTLFSPEMIEKSLTSFQKRKGLRVVLSGIFQTNIRDYDFMYGFSGINSGKKLHSRKNSDLNAIEIRIDDLDNVDGVANKVESIIQGGLKVESWWEINNELYKVMKFERMSAFIIISLVLVISAFNILASLSMTVVEKKPDISTLKALGATSKTIRNIFLIEGMIIGTIGTSAGTLLGLGLCYGQQFFKWFRFDTADYIIDSVPVVVNYQDVAFISVFSLILTISSVIYPSVRAASTNIIQGIRGE